MNDYKTIYNAIQNSKGGVSFFTALGVMEPDFYVYSKNGTIPDQLSVSDLTMLEDIDLFQGTWDSIYLALYKKDKFTSRIEEHDSNEFIDLEDLIVVSSIESREQDTSLLRHLLFLGGTEKEAAVATILIENQEYIYIYEPMM